MLAAELGHRARRAQPHAPVPRQVRRSSASSCRPGCSSTRCSRPPTCSPTARTRSRSARTSASTSSSCATSPSASTRASARTARRARAPHPGGRRAHARPPGARAQDVDDRRRPSRARCSCSTSPTSTAQEVQAGGDRLRQRDRPRRRTSPGSRTSSRSWPWSAGVTPEQVEADMADARGYGDLKTAAAEAVVEWLAPVRERYAELRADEAALEASWPPAPRRPARMAQETLADVRVGHGRRTGASRPRRSLASGDDAGRRSRARPGGLLGAVRPPAHPRAARGGRPAGGRARRCRARLPRLPRGPRRARSRGGDRVPRPRSPRCWS